MVNYTEYLRNPLDEEYLVIPGESVEEGKLPKEELEVRNALAALKMLFIENGDLGVFSKLFNTEAYQAWDAKFTSHKNRTKDLIFSSRLHRAAYRRIVNSIPQHVRDYDKAFYDLLKTHGEKSA